MKIGIDISQIVYQKTGVCNYVQEMVRHLIKIDSHNEYILFGASLRKNYIFKRFFNSLPQSPRIKLFVYPIPPTILEFIWNRLHIFPVELFIGDIDIFWSSDWTQPPLKKSVGITTLHDLVIFKSKETMDKYIIKVQKRRIKWLIRECKYIFCDSLVTFEDAKSLLMISPQSLKVIYPGFTGIHR